MTYDPHSRRAAREANRGIGGGTMAAIAVAALLGLGALFYAMSDNDRTASTGSSAPQTTGQGQRASAPAPTTAPNANNVRAHHGTLQGPGLPRGFCATAQVSVARVNSSCS